MDRGTTAVLRNEARQRLRWNSDVAADRQGDKRIYGHHATAAELAISMVLPVLIKSLFDR